jgi:hypothetical protein
MRLFPEKKHDRIHQQNEQGSPAPAVPTQEDFIWEINV